MIALGIAPTGTSRERPSVGARTSDHRSWGAALVGGRPPPFVPVDAPPFAAMRGTCTAPSLTTQPAARDEPPTPRGGRRTTGAPIPQRRRTCPAWGAPIDLGRGLHVRHTRLRVTWSSTATIPVARAAARWHGWGASRRRYAMRWGELLAPATREEESLLGRVELDLLNHRAVDSDIDLAYAAPAEPIADSALAMPGPARGLPRRVPNFRLGATRYPAPRFPERKRDL